MGALGIGGGIALYKNRDTVAEFLGLTNKEKKAKLIALGKELASDEIFKNKLAFDEEKLVFEYRGEKMGLHKMLKKTADGKEFDKEATKIALQERMLKIDEKNPDVVGYSKTKELLEKNPDIHQLYSTLGSKVNTYGESLHMLSEPL
jgi:hypothetical protein